MRVVISSGHGTFVGGAADLINEVTEARRVVPQVAEYMRQCGAEVVEFYENVATKQDDNVNNIIQYHNSKQRDLDISVHFNSDNKGTRDAGIGTEVLFYTQGSQANLALSVVSGISTASGLINRGAKPQSDFGFLSRTTAPAILIEVCFVNSREDVRLYQANFNAICKAIAEAVTGVKIASPPPQPEHWADPAWDRLNAAGITINEKRYPDRVTRAELFVLLDQVVNKG